LEKLIGIRFLIMVWQFYKWLWRLPLFLHAGLVFMQ